MPSLIESIRQRAQKQTEFGYGIMTADRYVKNMQDVVGLDLCYQLASTRQMSFADALQKASKTLVYSNQDMLVLEKGTPSQARLDGIEVPKNTLMLFKHVLTSPRKDRDGDVLRTEGALVDPKMLLLWQHVHTLPIGKMLAVVEHNSKRLTLLSCIVDINELSHDAAVMVDNDMARFSHGFRALEFSELKETEGEVTSPGGFDIKKFEIMEESVVSVPSNADAEVQEVMLSLVEGGKLTSPMMKEYGKTLRQQQPLMVVSGITFDKGVEDETNRTEKRIDFSTPKETHANSSQDNGTEKDGSSLPQVKIVDRCNMKRFDVELEHLEASKLEYEWASRWLDCQIKEMQVVSTFVPNFRKGSFLTGLKHEESKWELRDTRKLTRDGREEPPSYEVVQLNSRISDTFLTSGIKFYQTDQKQKICVKFNEGYGGVVVTTYVKLGNGVGAESIDNAWKFAFEHNFLKGESFSLAGDFIPKATTEWDEVFLEPQNKQALQRTIRLLNDQQTNMPNRGVIVMGPPGTGKTLSGRVVLNEAKATFIWVAAKDFWKMGAVDGLCAAFELAKELSPAVIFMEDVDNWMSSYAVDVIKTEMDGIGRTKGVVTILTTNYPERFPDALIDRPGRFHDVLLFDLPSERVRREMLTKWTEGAVSELTVESLVKSTDGFSGAHLFELVYFAKTLQTEDVNLSMDNALVKAVEKIHSQRELIDQSQLAGSNFRNNKDCSTKVKEYMRSLPTLHLKSLLAKSATEKAGRVLSAANLKMLQDCYDDLKACVDTDKNMARGTQAICERCMGRLEKVIGTASMDNDADEKPKKDVTVKEAMALFLAESTESDRLKMLAVLQTMESIKASDERVKQYKLFMGL